jgi:hypothetical protein
LKAESSPKGAFNPHARAAPATEFHNSAIRSPFFSQLSLPSIKENVTEGTMAETEPMTVDERRKCLHKVRLRCWVAPPKKERSRLLDEARAIPGVHRKSLMRPVQGELAGACAVCQPLALRQEIQTLIDRLSALPCAPKGVIEDVRLTLGEKVLLPA